MEVMDGHISFDDLAKGVILIGSAGSGKSVMLQETILRIAALGGVFVHFGHAFVSGEIQNGLSLIGREDDILFIDEHGDGLREGNPARMNFHISYEDMIQARARRVHSCPCCDETPLEKTLDNVLDRYASLNTDERAPFTLFSFDDLESGTDREAFRRILSKISGFTRRNPNTGFVVASQSADTAEQALQHHGRILFFKTHDIGRGIFKEIDKETAHQEPGEFFSTRYSGEGKPVFLKGKCKRRFDHSLSATNMKDEIPFPDRIHTGSIVCDMSKTTERSTVSDSDIRRLNRIIRTGKAWRPGRLRILFDLVIEQTRFFKKASHDDCLRALETYKESGCRTPAHAFHFLKDKSRPFWYALHHCDSWVNTPESDFFHKETT